MPERYPVAISGATEISSPLWVPVAGPLASLPAGSSQGCGAGAVAAAVSEVEGVDGVSLLLVHELKESPREIAAVAATTAFNEWLTVFM